VILVVGSQKIVPDLETALRRIRDYILPWEDAQVRKAMNIGSFVGKILLIERECVDIRHRWSTGMANRRPFRSGHKLAPVLEWSHGRRIMKKRMFGGIQASQACLPPNPRQGALPLASPAV
jgi:hypothetical protein